MRLIDLLNFGKRELDSVGIAEAELDARLLLEYCTKKSRTEIFLHAKDEVASVTHAAYMRLLMRRKKREPIAYILGEQEFWSLPFWVSPDVLIPRPETEFLLDRVFALTDPENFEKGKILDLCCGSGVIATVLGKETGKEIFALDISSKALLVTQKNAKRHCPKIPIQLIQGDLLSAFKENGVFSLIVSNPPYVSSFDVSTNLMPEVKEYEPHLALDGGVDGLLLIQKIRETLPTVLCPGGQCFIEIGADQGNLVKTLFQDEKSNLPRFQQVDILVDYAGRDRIVHARMAA